MKFIIDMNLSPRWVDVFNDVSIEAIHWSSVGGADATDLAIMAYAVAHGGAVLTHDLDFGAVLAATGGATPSVVQIRADDISPSAIGPQVIQALRQLASELERGALLTVEPGRARVRLLPLPAP